jgi:hypothetical protein
MNVKKRGPVQSTVILLATLLWASTVLYGGNVLWTYKTTPNAGAHAPVMWPSNAPVRFDPQRGNLVLLAHPQCPCTRASLTELERLLTRARGRLHAVVLFVKPHDAPPGWEETDLWRRARSMAGAEAVLDVDGEEAHLFRALTSGLTELYAPDGRLLFSGGITAARGHEGDSVGRAYIPAALEGSRLPHPNAPVFGCALESSESGGRP